MAYLGAAVLLIVAVLGAWLTTSAVLWAIWHARRSFRHSKQFSLWGLLFVFTVVALLMGAPRNGIARGNLERRILLELAEEMLHYLRIAVTALSLAA